MQLIFVRHGETDSNKKGTYLGWTDVELNEEGIRQAQCVNAKLTGIKIDAIYSSPLKRVRETADIINDHYDLDIIYENALMERNFGIWDDLTFKEITEGFKEEYDLWVKDWVNYCIKDGESASQVYGRLSAFLQNLIDSKKEGTYLIVTHLGCIRMAVAYLLGLQIEDSWRFKVDNCCVTKIEISDGYGVLTQLNG